MDDLKKQVHKLLAAAVTGATASGLELRQLQGIALYDGIKDSFVVPLEPFASVEAGLRQIALVQERYGVDQSHRITLQLVYEYFARAKAIHIDSATVDSLWNDFVAELESPAWLTRCVTNLRHFHCGTFHIDLGDGVSILGRDPAALSALGFSDAIQERLFAGWGGFGSSSFVLVAESSTPKRPDTFLGPESNDVWLRCNRAVGAMRLVAPGDVGLSPVFVQRIARFNVGIGGIHSFGGSIDTIGSPFTWLPEHRPAYDTTYSSLARLEKSGYGKAPGNLDLALRALMSSYDRYPTSADTKLVDAITALEAVLGNEGEVAFKLSFRVASLLAETDEQRAVLLKAVKDFYDTRSRIVHGGRLGNKHSASLTAVDDLRTLVRRLLRSFVEYAAGHSDSLTKRFFAEEIDAALIDATRREELRKVLGLSGTL
jgi:Apea-like HEPN